MYIFNNEQKLLTITGETFHYQTANTIELRVDTQATGFWEKGQPAFSDVTTFNPKDNRCFKIALLQCHIKNEKEKKKKTK